MRGIIGLSLILYFVTGVSASTPDCVQEFPIVLPTIKQWRTYPQTTQQPGGGFGITLTSPRPISGAWALHGDKNNRMMIVLARENDDKFVTTRTDNDDGTIEFRFRPKNATYGTGPHFQYESVWFGLTVNCGCYQINIDITHSNRQNSSGEQALGKIYALPNPEYVVGLRDSATFLIEVVRDVVDDAYSTFKFESTPEELDGSRIKYALHSNSTPVATLTYKTNLLGENVTRAEHTIANIAESDLGTSAFAYNVGDTFISVVFALRRAGDRRPAIGIRSCFAVTASTYHDVSGVPVIACPRGSSSACVAVQGHGVPRAEVAVALTDSEGQTIHQVLDPLTTEMSSAPHETINLFQIPGCSTDTWVTIMARNIYHWVPVTLKVAAIQRTRVHVQESYFRIDDQDNTITLSCSADGGTVESLDIYKASPYYAPADKGWSYTRPNNDVIAHWQPISVLLFGQIVRTSANVTATVTLSSADVTDFLPDGQVLFCAGVGMYDMDARRYVLDVVHD